MKRASQSKKKGRAERKSEGDLPRDGGAGRLGDGATGDGAAGGGDGGGLDAGGLDVGPLGGQTCAPTQDVRHTGHFWFPGRVGKGVMTTSKHRRHSTCGQRGAGMG